MILVSYVQELGDPWTLGNNIIDLSFPSVVLPKQVIKVKESKLAIGLDVYKQSTEVEVTKPGIELMKFKSTVSERVEKSIDTKPRTEVVVTKPPTEVAVTDQANLCFPILLNNQSYEPKPTCY